MALKGNSVYAVDHHNWVMSFRRRGRPPVRGKDLYVDYALTCRPGKRGEFRDHHKYPLMQADKIDLLKRGGWALRTAFDSMYNPSGFSRGARAHWVKALISRLERASSLGRTLIKDPVVALQLDREGYATRGNKNATLITFTTRWVVRDAHVTKKQRKAGTPYVFLDMEKIPLERLKRGKEGLSLGVRVYETATVSHRASVQKPVGRTISVLSPHKCVCDRSICPKAILCASKDRPQEVFAFDGAKDLSEDLFTMCGALDHYIAQGNSS